MEAFKTVANSLSGKEANLIRQAHKNLKVKQYMKAVKQIDKVLEKVPDHSETLAFKASIFNTLGRRDESLELAKKSIMKNMKNPLSWYSLSLIYNNERNFAEAYKTTQKAYALDPTNSYIMRNLSLLQIQLRDYEAFRDSRKSIMLKNPSVFINWVTYAVAEYFCGNLRQTVDIIDSFLKSMTKNISKIEHSEMILFKARVLAELDDHQLVVSWLEENKNTVLDVIAYKERLGRALLALDDPRCKDLALDLIKLNPEHIAYYDLLGQDRGASLKEIQAALPRSNLPFRAYLDIATDDFLSEFDSYIRPRLMKGIPSLFSDIRSLLTSRQESIVSLLDAHIKSLVEGGDFAEVQDYSSMTWSAGQSRKPPQLLMWTYFLAAQVRDYVKDHEAAFELIEKAINHTPTLPDLYLVKAKFFKHVGDLEKAVKFANKSRKLDLSDRFLNNKTAKYLLRNNQTQEAEEMMGLFSKERGDELNVHEMQSMWYELETGEAYLRKNEHEKAVTQLEYIQKHLKEMYEDQSDFHFYCMCKMNLNIYVDFLNFEDNIMANPKLLRAGIGLLSVYQERPDLYPIDKAAGLARLLIKHHPRDSRLAPLAFKVFFDQQKFLLCAKCLVHNPDPALTEQLQKALTEKTQPDHVNEVISLTLS